MSDSELQAELKERLENTTLPPWVVTGIRRVAWDQGHAHGQAEVDGYVLEWLTIFEAQQLDAQKPRA